MRLKPQLTTLLAMAMLSIATIGSAKANPLHNSNNPYDIDNDLIVTLDDVRLVVAEIQRQNNPGVQPFAASPLELFWDASNDGKLTPYDALLVMNHVTPTPEPSAYVTAGAGLLALAGYCWRRRKQQN
jgi:MYXO-CTERM domain-containing protein